MAVHDRWAAELEPGGPQGLGKSIPRILRDRGGLCLGGRHPSLKLGQVRAWWCVPSLGGAIPSRAERLGGVLRRIGHGEIDALGRRRHRGRLFLLNGHVHLYAG